MGKPFDPTNPLHNIITDEAGNPVPQKYDPEANSGRGGMVVVSTKLEEITFFNGLAITDTQRYNSGVKDLSKYKKVVFVVRKTLNANVSIGLSQSEGSSWYRYWDGSSFKRVAPPDNVIVIDNSDNNIINDAVPSILNNPLKELNISIECLTVPTAGSISITGWGVPN